MAGPRPPGHRTRRFPGRASEAHSGRTPLDQAALADAYQATQPQHLDDLAAAGPDPSEKAPAFDRSEGAGGLLEFSGSQQRHRVGPGQC